MEFQEDLINFLLSLLPFPLPSSSCLLLSLQDSQKIPKGRGKMKNKSWELAKALMNQSLGVSVPGFTY